MNRKFCDSCGEEILKHNAYPSSTPKRWLSCGGETKALEIGFDVQTDKGYIDICLHCLIDEVKKLDKRPQEKSA